MFSFVKKPCHIGLLSLAALLTQSEVPAFASTSATAWAAPCPVPQGSLTLPQIAEFALCNQAKTKESYAQVRLAQANSAETKAASGPQLSASLSASQTDSTLPLSGNSQQAQLRLSYVLFDFGKASARQKATQALEAAVRLDGDAQAQAVLLEASARYYSLQVAFLGKTSAEKALAAAQQSLDIAKTRFELGDAARADVLQAQAAFDEMRLKLAQSQGQLRAANASLALFIGAPAARSLALEPTEVSDPSLLRVPEQAGLPSLDSLLALAEQRSELRADAMRIQAARRNLEAAELALRPTLSTAVTGGWQTAVTGVNSQSTVIGLTLEVPLFDSGLSKSRTAQARAQLEATEARSLSQYRAIELEAVQAHVRVQTSYELLTSAQAFLRSSLESEAQAQGRYQEGVGILQDWLTSQTKLANAREQVVTAQAQLLQARVELARAVGTLTLDVF